MQNFPGPFRDCFTISSTRKLVHPTRIDQTYKKKTLTDPTYQETRLETECDRRGAGKTAYTKSKFFLESKRIISGTQT